MVLEMEETGLLRERWIIPPPTEITPKSQPSTTTPASDSQTQLPLSQRALAQLRQGWQDLAGRARKLLTSGADMSCHGGSRSLTRPSDPAAYFSISSKVRPCYHSFLCFVHTLCADSSVCSRPLCAWGTGIWQICTHVCVCVCACAGTRAPCAASRSVDRVRRVALLPKAHRRRAARHTGKRVLAYAARTRCRPPGRLGPGTESCTSSSIASAVLTSMLLGRCAANGLHRALVFCYAVLLAES